MNIKNSSVELLERTTLDYALDLCFVIGAFLMAGISISLFNNAHIIQDYYGALSILCLSIMFTVCAYLSLFPTRKLDKKYLKSLLKNPLSKNFLPIGIILSRESLLRIRIIRGKIYFMKAKKGTPIYEIRKKAIPKFSYSDISFFDKLLFKFGFIFLLLSGLFIFLAKSGAN